MPPSEGGVLSLYRVRRICPRCSYEWEGPSFVPDSTGLPLPRLCGKCCDEDDDRLRILTGVAMDRETPVPELRRPVRTDEDAGTL